MSKKILIVEDDPINVKFMKVVLVRKGGFEVVVSEDVEEILAIVGAGDVSAVIMDISLSRSIHLGQKVDGIYITRLLKADPATRGVPVILATAHAMTGDRERFLAETGAEHYLSKPLHDPDHFLAEVNKVFPA
ncbi:response regulator [Mesoterricola silvestris]|uniref:Response regulator n=1 Tax=Mesoterricola silvestris TaxID=2927979 RepID=A0AA48GSL4_9BACT|nr:response regulator [Mesoterricola silvestris]BDU73247.1 response regulator [Mesoterricola silvestris]